MKLSLYEIDRKIEEALDAVDFETGEILDEELAEKLGGLEEDRDKKIQNIALYIIHLVQYQEAVVSEIRKLQGKQKVLGNKISRLKKYLASSIGEGEKYKFSNVDISWRKSSSIVQDDDLDLEQYAKEYPILVAEEIVRTLDKKKARIFFEEQAELTDTPLFYDGISIVEKQNIQIK